MSSEVAKRRIDELVIQLVSSDFMFTDQIARRAVLTGELFQLLDKTECLKLDIYPRERIRGELQRSQRTELFEGVFLPVVARTDAALSKLIWIAKGNQRSRRDFRSIFNHCDQAQQTSIREQAAELDLSNLLLEVISESDDIR